MRFDDPALVVSRLQERRREETDRRAREHEDHRRALERQAAAREERRAEAHRALPGFAVHVPGTPGTADAPGSHRPGGVVDRHGAVRYPARSELRGHDYIPATVRDAGAAIFATREDAALVAKEITGALVVLAADLHVCARGWSERPAEDW